MDAEVVCAELRIPPVRCCRCVGHALQCLQSMKSGRGYAAKDASLDAVAATLLPALLRACRMRSAVAYCRNVVARAWAYRPRHSSRLAAAARLADSLEHALAVAVVCRRRLLAVRTYRKEGRHAKALACSMPQCATGQRMGRRRRCQPSDGRHSERCAAPQVKLSSLCSQKGKESTKLSS
jgi:hypothetical protein